MCCTVAIVFGGFLLFPAYSAEDVYPRYNIILVIIILVLFLHSWMNIRRLFLGKSLKWMLNSFVILTILSFGLSCINFVNYKEINRMALKRNVWHNYHIVLPESDVYDDLNRDYRRRATVMLVRDKVGATDPILLFRHTMDRTLSYNDYHRIAPDSLCHKIKEGDERFRYDEGLIDPCVIYADKDIPMKYVNNLKHQLSKAGVIRVEYAVVPVVREYNIRYYDYLGFRYVIPPYYESQDKVKELEKEISGISCVINVVEQSDHSLLMNDSLINRSEIRNLIKRHIKGRGDDYVIRYYINNSSPFSSYVSMVIGVSQAVNDLRNEYSMETYQLGYEELDYESQALIRKQIPVKLWEITEDMVMGDTFI